VSVSPVGLDVHEATLPQLLELALELPVVAVQLFFELRRGERRAFAEAREQPEWRWR